MGDMYDEDKGEEASMDEEIDLEEILNELELEEGEATEEPVAEGEEEEIAGLDTSELGMEAYPEFSKG